MMELPPFKLERFFAKYEFSAKYLLCSSDCESVTVGDLLALEPGAAQAFDDHWLGYTESTGAPSLRREIAGIYSSIEPGQILVHAGAQEAIYLFMQALLKPGDHIVVHWPCYQSLFEVARSLGCEVSFWEAHESNGWALDVDELKPTLRPETRAVIVNTPHNPTGYLMPREDFLALNRLTEERGLVLFSDEVYRGLEYDPSARLPAACDLNPTAVSLGVMSKTYGLAGLRIGWVATQNGELYARMAALKDYTTICNSAPSEFLAGLGLRHRDALVERNLAIIAENLAALDAFFTRRGDRFKWIRPGAGPIGFPRLLNGAVDGFCDELVRATGVLLLPGTAYDHPGNHFRIGFSRRNMRAGLDRLDEFLGK